MARITKTLVKRKTGLAEPDSVAYSDDFGRTWFWASNGAPVPMHVIDDYDLSFDRAAQKKACDDHTEAFLAEYRRNRRGPSDEELFEMRAAFGPGAEVVDVVTGQRYRV